MSVIAIIPARGGSKGLPRKNVRLLGGKPLLAYSIEAALQAELVDQVIVSTEDDEVADVARRFGARVPFVRPAELAEDETPTEPVLTHAMNWLEDNEGITVEVVVFLQPTDIFRRHGMIDWCVRRLKEDTSLETAFVAYKTHKNFWRIFERQYARTVDIPYGPRQKREPLYREDTGIACATRASLIREGKRVGKRVDILVNDDEAAGIDIHDEFTFWLAERVVVDWKWPVNA